MTVVPVAEPARRFCGTSGGEPARMVTETVSVEEAPRPSSAASVKVTVVSLSTCGAVNDRARVAGSICQKEWKNSG